jgi:hypothetical protein
LLQIQENKIRNVRGQFFKPRVVPFALPAVVEKELDKLEAMGVIAREDTSDCGTPLVPILKPNRSLRLCRDYKKTLNQVLKHMNHPLPRIDNIVPCMNGCHSRSNVWSKDSQRTIEIVKKEITSDRILVYFDSNLPIFVSCDSSKYSEYGTGATLSHVMPNSPNDGETGGFFIKKI